MVVVLCDDDDDELVLDFGGYGDEDSSAEAADAALFPPRFGD